MKINIEPNSSNRICLGCNGVVSGGTRVCPACGREMVPPGDHHPAAAAGDEAAQFYLGCQYFYGIDVPRDLAESEKWYRKAAEQGRIAAMNNVGLLRMLKDPPDHVEAAHWLHLAAEGGDAQAQHVFAGMLQTGLGVPQDRDAAERWFRAAAEQGNRQAADALAALAAEAETERNVAEIERNIEELCQKREDLIAKIEDLIAGLPQYPEEAASGDEEMLDRIVKVRTFVEAAKRIASQARRVREVLGETRPLREAVARGDAEAQRKLDEMHASSKEAARDYDQAMRHHLKAAELGDLTSLRRLGQLCAQGAPVVLDLAALESWMAEARAWLGDFSERLRSIEQGGGEQGGMREAPDMLLVTAPDPVEAAKWFRMAADQGDTESQRLLAGMYTVGNGVPLDADEEGRWYRKAAEAGDVLGQVDYAFFLLRENVGTPGEAEAERWFQTAAGRGDGVAEFMHATLFGDFRRFSAEDRASVVFWLQLGVDRDDPRSMLRLAEVHRCGEGAAQDDAEAARLYRKAFGLNPEILGASGYMTWRWDAQEIAEAIFWFRKFAEQGEPWAMEILGGLEKKAG